MATDDDIICTPAPAPVPDERSVKTEIIDRAALEAPKKTVKAVIIGILAVALLAGIVFALMVNRSGGKAAAATSAETATEGSAVEPAKTVVTATTSADEMPAECVGEITDKSLGYYCTYLLPFAKKVSADHDRLDRLEAAGKPAPADSGVPMALWVVLAGFGLLTVINTLLITSLRRKKSEETPPSS